MHPVWSLIPSKPHDRVAWRGVAWRGVAWRGVAHVQYDGRIVKVALHAMPVMLLCHCMFALFTFSGGTFFESEYVADALSSQVDVRRG